MSQTERERDPTSQASDTSSAIQSKWQVICTEGRIKLKNLQRTRQQQIIEFYSIENRTVGEGYEQDRGGA